MVCKSSAGRSIILLIDFLLDYLKNSSFLIDDLLIEDSEDLLIEYLKMFFRRSVDFHLEDL